MSWDGERPIRDADRRRVCADCRHWMECPRCRIIGFCLIGEEYTERGFGTEKDCDSWE